MDDGEDAMYDPIRTNPILVRVCRSWRAAVLDTPGFDIWLRSARSFTFDLTFDCEPYSGEVDDEVDDEEDAEEAAQELWEQEVTPNLSVLTTLEIGDSYFNPCIIFPVIAEIGEFATRLEILDISCVRNVDGFLNDEYPMARISAYELP